MSTIDFNDLTTYAKNFAGLTPERETLLPVIGHQIIPALPEITDAFYARLAEIPQTGKFLEGRVELLRKTHLRWLTSLFTGPFDASYAEAMYRVGDVHVKVNLPVEFMAGGTTMLNDLVLKRLDELYANDDAARADAAGAVNAIMGFTLIVMQQSFQNSSLHEELEKFLKITGMSRKLFDNLAAAYR